MEEQKKEGKTGRMLTEEEKTGIRKSIDNKIMVLEFTKIFCQLTEVDDDTALIKSMSLANTTYGMISSAGALIEFLFPDEKGFIAECKEKEEYANSSFIAIIDDINKKLGDDDKDNEDGDGKEEKSA